MDVIHIMSGSRTVVFELVRGPTTTIQAIDRMLDEVDGLKEVAWVTRNYGERLADISLEGHSRIGWHKAVGRIQEIFLEDSCRLRELPTAA